jgi:hypothetical protein
VTKDKPVIARLEQMVKKEGLRGTARVLGFSAPYIGDVLKGRRGVSVGVAAKVGFEWVDGRWKEIGK